MLDPSIALFTISQQPVRAFLALSPVTTAPTTGPENIFFGFTMDKKGIDQVYDSPSDALTTSPQYNVPFTTKYHFTRTWNFRFY